MLKRTSVLWVTVLMAAVLIAIAVMVGTALAQQASAPKSQDKLAKAEPEVKRLLLLMDTDKNGKISKQEWMTFMEAEFDRLDKDKSGELDVKELTQTPIRGFHK
jgi:hypothetical protein